MWTTTLTCTGLFTETNVKLRAAAAAQVFITLLLYMLSQAIYTGKYMNPEGEADQQPPWDNEDWRQWFAILFSTHTVCMATSGMFYPAAAVFLGWLHFSVLCGLCGYRLLAKQLQQNVSFGLLGGLATSNILLVILAMVGLRVHNCY